MKKVEELCELQEPLKKYILTHDDFLKQKSIVLGAKRKLIQ